MEQRAFEELCKRVNEIEKQVSDLLERFNNREKKRRVTTKVDSRAEYCKVAKGANPLDVLPILQAMGEDGWTMCGMESDVIYLYRLVSITHTYLLDVVEVVD